MTKSELCRLEQPELMKLIDEGRLVYLPCKLSDIVYWISNFKGGIYQGTVAEIKISGFGFDLVIWNSAGQAIKKELKCVFFTREEAEQKLKESEKNK